MVEGQNWLDVMTNDISCTSLWRKAFIENRKDCSTAEQDFFRQHLEDMRERVKPLVARIMRDMPGVSSEEAARPNQEQAEQASLILETSTTFDSRPLLLVFGRPDHQ
jgi:hypothetical protein